MADSTCNPATCGKTLLNGILAGICIGIAGTVFLAVPNSSYGAFLFGLGLLTILCYQFKLYTGAIGYVVNQGSKTLSYIVQLFFIWLGNFIGTFVVGALVRQSRTFPGAFSTRIANVAGTKLNDSWSSILILAFFCGILMYVAVEGFKKAELHPVIRMMLVFLCVTVFILCGFEHSIAGMYYFAVAGEWNMSALQCVLLMTLGNSLGGILIPLANKIR